MLTHFYKDDSSLVWNGACYRGRANIASLMQQLPRSNHSVHSIDAQPLRGESVSFLDRLRLILAIAIEADAQLRSSSESGIFLMATGTLTLGSASAQQPLLFSDHFMLSADHDKPGYHIINHVFRGSVDDQTLF